MLSRYRCVAGFNPPSPRNPTASRSPANLTPRRAPAMPCDRMVSFAGGSGSLRNVLSRLAFGVAGVATRPVCRGGRRLMFFHAPRVLPVSDPSGGFMMARDVRAQRLREGCDSPSHFASRRRNDAGPLNRSRGSGKESGDHPSPRPRRPTGAGPRREGEESADQADPRDGRTSSKMISGLVISMGPKGHQAMTLTYRDRGASGTQIDAVAGNLCIATLYKASPPAKASSVESG